tara:strand:+ start:26033 stop:26749 length:717 start_codon:yes stop_codon:yes gene_type:complete
MFSKTNIKTVLQKVREIQTSENKVLTNVKDILRQNEIERKSIKDELHKTTLTQENAFNFDSLKTAQIFHISAIEKLCIDYRLRFLDARYFKGPFPDEAITKIRTLEKEHNTTLKGFKIVAPSKLMKLENADDPLLFAPIGNDYFYLIHKWGNDLHPFRKAMVWPYKTFENLVFTILIISIFLAGITPLHLFSSGNPTQEYLLYFLFVFKGVAGIVLFYGFAKGKNFNNAIWRSKYYNA